MRLRPEVVAALAVAFALLLVAGAGGAAEPTTGAAGWESLLGDRPTAQLGNRWVVVLAKPSLASHVLAVGGHATEERERGWTAKARRDQRDVLARLAFRGAPIEPEHSFMRVFNGFAAPLDARALAIVQRDPDVKGVYPVRTASRPPSIQAVRRFRGRHGGPPAEPRHPGLHGRRGHRGAARHRGRPRASVHPAGARTGPRRARPVRRRERAPEPDRTGTSRTSWHRDGRSRGRLERACRAGGRRARSGAAADPRRGLAAGCGRRGLGRTAAPIRCSPGWSWRSTRTRTVTPTTPPGSRSSASWSRLQRSRTALSPGRPRGRQRSTRSLSPRPETTGRPALPTAASAARAVPPRRSPQARWTRDGAARPATFCSCRSARARLGRAAARRGRRPRAVRQRAGRRPHALDAGDRRGGRRAPAPLRQLRLQPRRRHGRAAPARDVFAGGGARGRRGRCGGRARRRPAARGLARHRQPCRRPDPRAVHPPSPRPSGASLRLSVPVSLAVGRPRSTRTRTAARRRRSPRKGSRSTGARSPR